MTLSLLGSTQIQAEEEEVSKNLLCPSLWTPGILSPPMQQPGDFQPQLLLTPFTFHLGFVSFCFAKNPPEASGSLNVKQVP